MNFLSGRFLAIAHRGGSLYPPNVGHENTMAAFETAVGLGYRYLETDIHTTRDGVAVAFHDASLDRVTDGHGSIANHTYAQLRTVRVGGDHAIPRLDELLDAFPHVRFNIDMKAPGTVAALVDVLERTRAWDRVCVASFSKRRMDAFRARFGHPVTTGAGTAVIAAQLIAFALGARRNLSSAQVLQCPVSMGPIRILTRQFIDAAHEAGLKVHAWTIDDPVLIGTLIDLGIDGIISDRIDVLKAVLIERGLWES